MRRTFSHCHFSNLASIEQLNLHEITERLDVLNGQHAELTEKLRELHGDNSVQAVAQIKWQDLKSQVAKLRFEIESFKQIF